MNKAEEILDQILDAVEQDASENGGRMPIKYKHIYDNFMEMIKDVKDFASQNGKNILPCDEPMTLTLGYVCANTGESWGIRIANVASFNNEMKKHPTLQKCLNSRDGRMMLLDYINS